MRSSVLSHSLCPAALTATQADVSSTGLFQWSSPQCSSSQAQCAARQRSSWWAPPFWGLWVCGHLGARQLPLVAAQGRRPRATAAQRTPSCNTHGCSSRPRHAGMLKQAELHRKGASALPPGLKSGTTGFRARRQARRAPVQKTHGRSSMHTHRGPGPFAASVQACGRRAAQQ